MRIAPVAWLINTECFPYNKTTNITITMEVTNSIFNRKYAKKVNIQKIQTSEVY